MSTEITLFCRSGRPWKQRRRRWSTWSRWRTTTWASTSRTRTQYPGLHTRQPNSGQTGWRQSPTTWQWVWLISDLRLPSVRDSFHILIPLPDSECDSFHILIPLPYSKWLISHLNTTTWQWVWLISHLNTLPYSKWLISHLNTTALQWVWLISHLNTTTLQ